MPRKRGKGGKWKLQAGTYVDSKGYISICAGPLAGVRVHRLIASAKLGRPLEKHEDVHHIDGNKLNCHPDNLKVMGHREHGCVSAKQHFYVKQHDIKMEQAWNEYHDSEPENEEYVANEG